MNSELKRQEKVLDAVTDHTDRSAYELQNVSQQAKKDFKVRPGEPFSAINAPGNVCMPEHRASTIKMDAQRQEALCRSSTYVSWRAPQHSKSFAWCFLNGHCGTGRLSMFFDAQPDRAGASSVRPYARPQSLSELGRLSTSE